MPVTGGTIQADYTTGNALGEEVVEVGATDEEALAAQMHGRERAAADEVAHLALGYPQHRPHLRRRQHEAEVIDHGRRQRAEAHGDRGLDGRQPQHERRQLGRRHVRDARGVVEEVGEVGHVSRLPRPRVRARSS